MLMVSYGEQMFLGFKAAEHGIPAMPNEQTTQLPGAKCKASGVIGS